MRLRCTASLDQILPRGLHTWTHGVSDYCNAPVPATGRVSFVVCSCRRNSKRPPQNTIRNDRGTSPAAARVLNGSKRSYANDRSSRGTGPDRFGDRHHINACAEARSRRPSRPRRRRASGVACPGSCWGSSSSTSGSSLRSRGKMFPTR